MITHKESVNVALILSFTSERIVGVARLVFGVAPCNEIRIDDGMQFGFISAVAKDWRHFLVEWKKLSLEVVLCGGIARKVNAHFHGKTWQSGAQRSSHIL